ncbi:myb-related transcription factor, partner of profilin-like [Polyodon spathula]|uniref:myb-related transcription factor, partner of profilin-like n=1 Tax=Polyodon spathula TaxID=7913 RepID=UPI001B7DBD43|nr:myb-related transcription factor, partner of profilin-like [Polyodon spathula]
MADSMAHEGGSPVKERQRKPKFTPDQIQLLRQEVLAHASKLYGKNISPVPERKMVWQEITRHINEHSKTERSVIEVQKRWQDERRGIKKRAQDLWRVLLETGQSLGGLTPQEEAILGTLDEAALGDLGGPGLSHSALQEQAAPEDYVRVQLAKVKREPSESGASTPSRSAGDWKCEWSSEENPPELLSRYPELNRDPPELLSRHLELNGDLPELPSRYAELNRDPPELPSRYPELNRDPPELLSTYPELNRDLPELLSRHLGMPGKTALKPEPPSRIHPEAEEATASWGNSPLLRATQLAHSTGSVQRRWSRRRHRAVVQHSIATSLRRVATNSESIRRELRSLSASVGAFSRQIASLAGAVASVGSTIASALQNIQVIHAGPSSQGQGLSPGQSGSSDPCHASQNSPRSRDAANTP